MEQKKYYLGLDIGTDSIGWAVTDTEYNLLKFHGKTMWGSHLFEEGKLKEERRSFRTARRRLDRKKQRIQLLRELFAKEIAKADPRFYQNIETSILLRSEDKPFSLFNSPNYTDVDYHREYPTIHHLIMDLINNDQPHDVRLVYLACSWLLSNRGHFLSEIGVDNIGNNFSELFREFEEVVSEESWWPAGQASVFEKTLPEKISITDKNKELVLELFGSKTAPKFDVDSDDNIEPAVMIKLLCGSQIKAKDLFPRKANEYEEIGGFSLKSDDETLALVFSQLEDDATVVIKAKALFDWALLTDIMNGKGFISEAKVDVYNQHEKDLAFLKAFVKKYAKDKYKSIFVLEEPNNYVAYINQSATQKKASKDEFSKYLKSIVAGISVEEIDVALYQDMLNRLEQNTFLPKQKDTDNRVIPHQVYQKELALILNQAKKYLPFLNERDNYGTVADKISSIFTFRVPYFVGPLVKNADDKNNHAWIVRKAEGKIYPWNFEEKVDLEKSEEAFIDRMINRCTYLPEESVLPMRSLCYERFKVLNEINPICIDGRAISVEVKQRLYTELFEDRKRVTKKAIEGYLYANGLMEKGQVVSGIDEQIKSSLASYHDFKRLLKENALNETEVEDIINRATYVEDSRRMKEWLDKNYSKLSEEDRKYISRLKFKDFGRLSKKFLNGFEGCEKRTGEVCTVLSALWNTNDNLMQILSDRYTFAEMIAENKKEFYSLQRKKLADRMNEMYLSNSVQRQVYRAYDVVGEVVKAMGQRPEKLFIEMTRAADPKKGRTKSRKEQILELYKNCKDEMVPELLRELNNMGEMADNRLQSEKLFLYFIQLGRSLYSGKRIEIEQLGSEIYDIDHIYPQRFVKDDSVLNNKVLCLSEENGDKQDKYPVAVEIQTKQKGFWQYLKEHSLITEEKYKRLVRTTSFSDAERLEFINRQLVETSQATKAVATLLSEKLYGTKIVYSKAGMVSEFRHEFDCIKSRAVNDLHHAKDAYLNIVVGNVYDMKFNRAWFSIKDATYTVNLEALFKHEQKHNDTVFWNGEADIAKVKKAIEKNNALLTRYAFCRKGGLFNQTIYPAGKGVVERKKGLSIKEYGGYDSVTRSFFVLASYDVKKGKELQFVPVDLMHANIVDNEDEAKRYAATTIWGDEQNKDLITFPLGLRRIKINSVVELDGFKCVISGLDNSEKLSVKAINALSLSKECEDYVKKLENLAKKVKEKKEYVPVAQYDLVTEENNRMLFETLYLKAKNAFYNKRPSMDSVIKDFEKTEKDFLQWSLVKQAQFLLDKIAEFGRGGRATLSVRVTNWKKKYKEVYLVDQSSTGLWEKKSSNLLTLL